MIKPDEYAFNSQAVKAKVYYSKGWLDYTVIKIVNVELHKLYFRSVQHYILSFIDHIKDNIMKQFTDLSLVSINLYTYDENNILHRFILKVTNLIQDFLKQERKICFKKTVLVDVEYQGNIQFIGGINFAGLD